MENISNTFFLMLYVMVTNYVLVVACAEEGSLNFSSDRVTEEILYCSNQDAKNPPSRLRVQIPLAAQNP